MPFCNSYPFLRGPLATSESRVFEKHGRWISSTDVVFSNPAWAVRIGAWSRSPREGEEGPSHHDMARPPSTSEYTLVAQLLRLVRMPP